MRPAYPLGQRARTVGTSSLMTEEQVLQPSQDGRTPQIHRAYRRYPRWILNSQAEADQSFCRGGQHSYLACAIARRVHAECAAD